MRGIEPQPVHVILSHPVHGILDEKASYLLAMLTIQVDALAPGTPVRVCKVVGAERVRICAVGAEVVVDHVEQHGQSVPMGGVNQRSKIIGCSVTARRCKQCNAVVPPVVVAGKVADGHDLDGRYPEVCERLELAHGGAERALRCKGADVELIDGQVVEGRRRPCAVRPPVLRRVDDR
jgi:hypothetical protein